MDFIPSAFTLPGEWAMTEPRPETRAGAQKIVLSQHVHFCATPIPVQDCPICKPIVNAIAIFAESVAAARDEQTREMIRRDVDGRAEHEDTAPHDDCRCRVCVVVARTREVGGQLASIADAVNMALRDVGRHGAQAPDASYESIREAINQLVYESNRNCALLAAADDRLSEMPRIEAQRDGARGEREVYRDAWNDSEKRRVEIEAQLAAKDEALRDVCEHYDAVARLRASDEGRPYQEPPSVRYARSLLPASPPTPEEPQ
jgi:hypothetical protein